MKKIIVGSLPFEVENWANNHRGTDLSAHPIAGVAPEVQDRISQEAAMRGGSVFFADVSFVCAGCFLNEGDHFSTDTGEKYQVLRKDGTTYHANRIAKK